MGLSMNRLSVTCYVSTPTLLVAAAAHSIEASIFWALAMSSAAGDFATAASSMSIVLLYGPIVLAVLCVLSVFLLRSQDRKDSIVAANNSCGQLLDSQSST